MTSKPPKRTRELAKFVLGYFKALHAFYCNLQRVFTDGYLLGIYGG